MSTSPEKPVENTSDARPPESPADKPGANLGGRAASFLQPLGRWFWLNLRVWAPFLATPQFRACTVKYTPKEGRTRDTWTIELPKRCWKTGAEQGLVARRYAFDVRSFESPAGIVAVAAGVGACCWLLALLAWSWFLPLAMLGILCLLGGAALLFVKSWTEPVELTIWTRPEHADALRRPDAVAHDGDLYLILPDEAFAEAARTEAAARRRSSNKYAQDREVDRDPTMRSSAAGAEASSSALPRPAKREELPPIKLEE